MVLDKGLLRPNHTGLQPTFKIFFSPFDVNCGEVVIDLISRVFTNGLGNRGSIPSQVIPKTQKMVLDAALLNTQHYKAVIDSKLEQSRELSGALPYTSV